MSAASIWNSIRKENTIQARIVRWHALWALEDLPRPLWYLPADPVLSLTSEYAMKQK